MSPDDTPMDPEELKQVVEAEVEVGGLLFCLVF